MENTKKKNLPAGARWWYSLERYPDEWCGGYDTKAEAIKEGFAELHAEGLAESDGFYLLASTEGEFKLSDHIDIKLFVEQNCEDSEVLSESTWDHIMAMSDEDEKQINAKLKQAFDDIQREFPHVIPLTNGYFDWESPVFKVAGDAETGERTETEAV